VIRRVAGGMARMDNPSGASKMFFQCARSSRLEIKSQCQSGDRRCVVWLRSFRFQFVDESQN
jgi:hypothetical protein